MRKVLRLALPAELMEMDVRLYPYFEVVGIRDAGVMAVNEGSFFFLKADTVILAVGFQPVTELLRELTGTVSEIHAIGDCVEPQDALAAVSQGAEIGRLV